MDMFKRIIKHYIILALERAGSYVRVDDTHAELDAAMEDLDAHIRRVVRAEHSELCQQGNLVKAAEDLQRGLDEL